MDASNGRIVVVWNLSLSVVIFFKSDQLVLCGVHDPATNKLFNVAFVYVRPKKVVRRPLWEDILSLVSSRILSTSPGLCLGISVKFLVRMSSTQFITTYHRFREC